MADSGHYGKHVKGRSRQGTYIFTAEGKFLSSVNDLSADLVLKAIERGLEKWNALPESEKMPSETPGTQLQPKHRWEDYYPRDGLVFTIYNRDLPADHNPDSQRLPTWNRDSAWFSVDEQNQFVPENLKTGETFDFPKLFVSRLCRLHFIDSVKGQAETFEEYEITGSKMSGTVTKKAGTVLSIEVTGTTYGHRDKGRRNPGVETKLLGTAVYDESKKRFSKFDFVALGERWGNTLFNDRRQQLERSPVGYVFELAQPDALPITPGVIWEYEGLAWLKHPSE